MSDPIVDNEWEVPAFGDAMEPYDWEKDAEPDHSPINGIMLGVVAGVVCWAMLIYVWLTWII